VRMRLIPGFTQTIRSWDTVEARLPRDWDVQAIEVPDGLDFAATAETIGIRGSEGAWVGYSLGGRLALRLALDRPDLVERVALIGASPGIASAGERERRLVADERLAQQAESDGVQEFLERWYNQRMFETLPREAAMLDDRRRGNTVHRIAHQLRALGPATQEPLWDRLSKLSMPVLIVSGAYDRKYTEIAEQMGAAIGATARVEQIPRAGHAVHLERPDEVAELLVSWAEGSA
jgi:2-succinyl-6-hydroxy-2,4-cyclohexadiene-1-carboxylate synthase